MSTPDSHANYWIDKLGGFRHGPRFFPHVIASDPTGVAAAEAGCTLAAGCAVPLDLLGWAALVLVASRHNGGEPVLAVWRDAAAPATATFTASGAWNNLERVDAFLARQRQELEASRGHAPCPMGVVASGLGLDADACLRAVEQLSYGCGWVPHTHDNDGAGVQVRVWPSGTDVRVRVTAHGTAYATDLVPRLAEQLARATGWLSANPDSVLGDFDLVAPGERRSLLHGFHDTQMSLPSGLTVHGLVAAQAARTPDAPAIIYGDTTLTYRALNGQANHLAAILQRDFRVEPGARVGVMMERSEKTVVALCGVMKAGAAYVPINPRHPWETVRYMIDNAGITVLIVDSESIAAAASFAGQLLVVDIELRGGPQAEDTGARVTDTDLAYVIYTSGSTGRPKGVAVEHRAVVNTILWRNAFYGIGPADINLQVPSFAFDSSVLDIFCVLTVGGTLVIPAEALRLDARRLLELSAAHGVTSCIVTPSYYKLLLGDMAGAVPTLRWVTLAGESASPDLVAAHLRTLPAVALFNEYGPTENAVCSTACRLDAAERTVSIGRPIWNVSVLVLDADRRLVPIGVPGEIYLGGAGLARGYLNQESLTAERFLALPIADAPPGPWYRTGDRACWRTDGALEFLGRLDSQVKVRGFRIELEEVEQALRRHPGIESAAVLCKEDPGGAKYLAAYVEISAGLTGADVRRHLAGEVPAYMVPDVFTLLPQLPLNLNGKIDRVALAALDDAAEQPAGEPVVLSSVQSSLISLWADILNRSQVTLDDNFFAMGGNSLRVMELTSRIRGELSRGVELLDVYTYPTVRELADQLERTAH